MKFFIALLALAITGCASAMKPAALKVQLPSSSASIEDRKSAYESLRVRSVEDNVLLDGGSADNMSLVNKTWYDPYQMRSIFRDCRASKAERELRSGANARRTAIIIIPAAPVVGAAVGAFLAILFSDWYKGVSDSRIAAGAGIGAGVGVVAAVAVGTFGFLRWNGAPRRAAGYYNDWLIEQLDLTVLPDGGAALKLGKKF